MSKHNKVNKDHYTQRGRLTPDEAAREQVKQRQASSPKQTEGGQFGERTERAVTRKDSPAPQENEDGAASARQAQTRDAKQSD